MGTTWCGKTLYAVQPITRRRLRDNTDGVKLPSHPNVLALLGAILPVMDLRTRHSAAWILVAALSSVFWLSVAVLVFLAVRMA